MAEMVRRFPPQNFPIRLLRGLSWAQPWWLRPSGCQPLGVIGALCKVKRTGNAYDDKPSKVTGEVDCFHLESKVNGVAALRRLGIHSVADLFAGGPGRPRNVAAWYSFAAGEGRVGDRVLTAVLACFLGPLLSPLFRVRTVSANSSP
jgi:hypothetical protein